MLDTIGAFGSGIGTNLLSDSLSKKLEAFKDKKAISSFTQSLRDWEIEYELSDVFSPEKAKNTYRVRNAFLYGLLWRKTTSITEHTIDYINSEILQYEYSFKQFVDVLFALSARPNHPLNAKNAFNFFHGAKMSDRDATFIPIFDELYSNHDSALYRLVEWGLVHASKQAVTDDISGVDFMGRWMPEAQSNSAMYNKEYYWSDAHTFFNNPYYCGLEWVNIDSDRLNCVFPEKVLIPVKQYYSERKGELNNLNSEIASIYWHKPCEEIYTKLQLKYLKGSNSAFVDSAGELVCFDSSELIGNDTGFYIRYDKLLEFLESSSYTLVWTSLCEKRILTPSFGRWDLPPKAIHMSSVYYLKDGKITKASETLFEDRLYY